MSRFDPTILKRLEQADYDRTFQEVMARTERRSLVPFVKENADVAIPGYEFVEIGRHTGSR